MSKKLLLNTIDNTIDNTIFAIYTCDSILVPALPTGYSYEIEDQTLSNGYIKRTLRNNDGVYPSTISFEGKTKLKTVEYIRLDENVNSFRRMFYGCYNLTSVDLSSLDTKNVTNMRSMFEECRALTSLDLSNFNTLNLTNITYMFYYCSGLTYLDLSSFNTNAITNNTDVFYNVTTEAIIKVSSSFKLSEKDCGWNGTFTVV